jgi:acetyl esterase
VALDPQARAYLEWAAAATQPVQGLTPAEARRQAERHSADLFGAKEAVDSVVRTDVDSPLRAGGAGVRVRIYAPSPDPDLPLTVYLHGGGWVVGLLEGFDGVCRALANRSGSRVVAVDYRLAPEHRFPAALDDAWAVTRWAFTQGPRVAVAGDSAGGNLAAVVALRARDAGLPLACQVLVYPVTDHHFDRRSYVDNDAGFGLTGAAMRWYWEQYLGDADGAHPDASPLRAPSLVGAAPALVVVCDHDPLRDEGVEYAERLRQAGVPVRLSEYSGMIHGFLRLPARIDRSREALDEIGQTLRQALGAD